MPAPVVALVDHDRVLFRQVLAGLVHVGDVINLSFAFRVVLLRELFERSELGRKGDHLLIGQMLIAETQHVIGLEGVAYRL